MGIMVHGLFASTGEISPLDNVPVTFEMQKDGRTVIIGFNGEDLGLYPRNPLLEGFPYGRIAVELRGLRHMLEVMEKEAEACKSSDG